MDPLKAVVSRQPAISRRLFLGSSGAALATAAALVTDGPSAGAAPVLRASPSWQPAADAMPVPVNVQVSTDGPGSCAHLEPAVAADPGDPRILLAACRVVQDGKIGMVSYRSQDGGAKWIAGGPLPGLTPDYDGNPSVAFDRVGTGYICGIAAGTSLPRRGDALLWRTHDAGRTLLPPVTAISGDGGLADHCDIAADPAGAAGRTPVLYATAILAGAANNGLVFTRSTDGGSTFAPPAFLAPEGSAQAPVVAVADGGTVCVVYLTRTEDAILVNAATSTDHGLRFAAPIPLTTLAALTPSFGDVFSARSGPTAAADDVGRLYAAITGYDSTDGTSRILLCTSADRGRTWDGPVPIASSAGEIYLQPRLAAHGRRAAVSCYVIDPVTRRIDVRLYFCAPGEPAATGVRRVTSRPIDPTLGPGTPPWLGNYQGLAATRDGLHPMWTDTRTGTAQIFTAALRT